jgi:hypothetical protein
MDRAVFSSGGGTQSTAIAALIIQGKIERPDHIVIADTGYECQSTWDYLDEVVNPALRKVNLECERIPMSYQITPEHGDRWLSHNRNTVLMPMWTDQIGQPGKLSGYCTNTWKVEVVDRYLSRKYNLKRKDWVKWIGFSLDENRRAARMMAGDEYQKGLVRFPLIESRSTRRQSIEAVEAMGWPLPPRSRCFICPNQSHSEWQEVAKNRPEEIVKAAQLEAQINAHDSSAWLRRECLPINDIDLAGQDELFADEDYCSSGVCFV